jgi:hypothetical protein
VHTASLLVNGKVLVTGGTVDDDTGMNSTELYDPSTGMWTNAGNMQMNRVYHSASMLTNGNVLVTAGGPNGAVTSNTAELYNSSTETFTSSDSIQNLQSSHKIFMLTNGKMSVIGESNSKTFNNRQLH